MGRYVEIGGTDTWYDEEGDGDPLVLLHGGLCTNETWGPQMSAFVEHLRVFAPERQGHGHTADGNGPMSYTTMATETIRFLEEVVGGPAHLVGWSDGGIVGLIVAGERPDLVRKLVALGANYDVGGVVPEVADMFRQMDPGSDGMAMFRKLYEKHSPDGPEHWPVVFRKFVDMMLREPQMTTDELARISVPTLVMVGDDDMVTLEHTIALFRALPNAELAVVPGTSHALGTEKPDLVNRLILDFLQHDPVATMVPVRRAAAAADAH